jgi:hypothetical protein
MAFWLDPVDHGRATTGGSAELAALAALAFLARPVEGFWKPVVPCNAVDVVWVAFRVLTTPRRGHKECARRSMTSYVYSGTSVQCDPGRTR